MRSQQTCTMILLLCLTIAAATANLIPVGKIDQPRVTANNDYRLSNNVSNIHYDIELEVPLAALQGQSTIFSGRVNITFEVTESTDRIFINSLVNIINMTLTGSTGSTPAMNYTPNYTINSTTEITTITVIPSLTPSSVYLLVIDYTANMDPVYMTGFYRSQYVANNVTEYLGTTQFQPTNARRAFPCFDEPQYKATFILTIKHPTEFSAVANTPLLVSDSATTESTGDQYRRTTFEQTPLMSTYLLAFTVSKFDCTRNLHSNIIFGVCSRKDYVNQRSLPLDYGNKLMTAMEQWTNITYESMGIDKMDQFAIPDFSAGAMENWGLVTYREYLLLFDEANTSNRNKQRILSIIAHEFAHMWFGNLLTTHWWDTLFLNEGFASYFEYLLLTKLPELRNYEMDKQFITDVHQSALSADAVSSSLALTSEAWTPGQIWNKFNPISYHKGASLLRMVENLIGSTNFQTGLRDYLQTHQFKSVVPANLWTSLDNSIPVGILPNNVTFIDFISNWTNEAGFPVITATVNGDDIILSQKRFLYNGTNSTQWYVPVFCKHLSSVANITWLSPDGNVTLRNAAQNNSWVILNNNANGFYRVNYDHTLRQRIISALEQNHPLLTDIDRAQIIDDALNLARAGEIKYSEAFRILNHLKNESSYYPWISAINGLNFLSARLRDGDLRQRMNMMILELIENSHPDLYDMSWNNIEHVASLKMQTVWNVACRIGQQSCISRSRILFDEFKVGNIRLINPNIRSIVYCSALRNSTDYTDWDFLWGRLSTTNDPHETLYILTSLGCSTNRTNLEFLLDHSISNSSLIRIQDFNTVWSSVYTSSSIGLQVAMRYFFNNTMKIITHYPDAISHLPAIASMLTTQEEIKELRRFLDSLNSTAISEVGAAALKTAEENLHWQSIVTGDLQEHFNAAPSLQVTFSLMLAAIVIKFII